MTKNETVCIHASCIRLSGAGAAFGAPEDAGVLILGKSGAGKSDLSLHLIALGAELVADDQTLLFVFRGKLYARPPERIAGLIEARGVGIVKIAHVPRVRIVLAVELGSPVPRLPEPRRFRPPAALALLEKSAPMLVKLAPFEASTPAKIALAVAAYAHGLHRDTVNII